MPDDHAHARTPGADRIDQLGGEAPVREERHGDLGGREARGVAGLREAHPDIELYVSIANHVVDFVKEGFDMAVRLGRIEDAALVAARERAVEIGTSTMSS